MEPSSLSSSAAFILGWGEGVFVGILILYAFISRMFYPVSRKHWQCTKSRVINDELPREEEATQYTLKSEIV